MKFYLTTPIYYVNDHPHLGHAYTTVAADVMARYKRLRGFEVFFLTGTDEHGKKIERSARRLGEDPQRFVDRMAEEFRRLWERLNISYDGFVRTSSPSHRRAAQAFFRQVRHAVYLGRYEGWYCVPCETFWAESDLREGRCPDCGREVEWLSEESYFFRLSAYQEPLLRHLEEHPEFVGPRARRNEVLSFVRSGLRDLSISRSGLSWGVPVPGDGGQVIYVWFEALVNYLSGIGWPERQGEPWPPDLQLVGKDILRFHAVFWPAMLMAADLPLPRRVFAHGWWTVEGQKMSKSRGNVVDPAELVDRFGADPVRYFMMREVPFGSDGDFSLRALVGRLNGDLANDLGNLASRLLAMAERYLGGRLPGRWRWEDPERRLRERAEATVARMDELMDQLAFDRALEMIWGLIGETNRYLDLRAPWSLARDPGRREELGAVLQHGLEALRIASLLIWPFMPTSMERLWEAMGVGRPGERPWGEAAAWGGLPMGQVRRTPPLFPRRELDPEGRPGRGGHGGAERGGAEAARG